MKRDEKLMEARLKRRVMLYESPNIIECRDINDVLGDPPFCRRRYYFQRQKRKPLPAIHNDYAMELQQSVLLDIYKQETKHKIQRPRWIMFHERLPFIAFLADRLILTKERATRERIQPPIIIELMTEPNLRILQYSGITDRQYNVLQHCLSVRKRAAYAVFVGGCINTMEIQHFKVERDTDRINRIETAAEQMFLWLEEKREPPQTITNCDTCEYFRFCIQPKTIGEERKDIEEMARHWLQAERNVWEATKGREAIEEAIKHALREQEEAHTKSANISYKHINKWKLDSLRLMEEKPEIARSYRKTFTDRTLRISR